MKNICQKLTLVFFALIAIAISVEYKYHNVFRHISQRLLPANSILPKWFDRKILFHPSDWIAPILLIVVLFAARGSLQRLMNRGVGLSFALPLFAALSIAASTLAGYPVLYWHLWQLVTPIFLFAAAATLDESQRKKVLKVVFVTLALMGLFQSLVAITQYFGQESLGLRWLGEGAFHSYDRGASSMIAVPEGRLWVFDQWFRSAASSELVVRAAGTLPHANVLGGFLMMCCLITISLFVEAKKKGFWGAVILLQLTAIMLSFSRAALFGFTIGFGVWLFYQIRQKNRGWKPAILVVVSSLALIGCLFHEQIARRGGIVNYNKLAQDSDAERFSYQKIAFDMIKRHPLLGVGHQQFTYRIPEFLPPEKKSTFLPGATHNIYLLWASETGLLSLACYLTLIGYVAWIGLQATKEPAIPCLLGIFAGFLFIGCCDFYLLLFQAGKLMFFLVAGLIAAHRSYRFSMKPV